RLSRHRSTPHLSPLSLHDALPIFFLPAAFVTAITHHNAIQRDNARIERRAPARPNAGVAELRPPFLRQVGASTLRLGRNVHSELRFRFFNTNGQSTITDRRDSGYALREAFERYVA